MSMSTQIPKSTAGKLFLVSGLSGGREVFLGKALDEPHEKRLTLEGKALSFTREGLAFARPFSTTASFSLEDEHKTIHLIASPKAHEEAIHLLNLSVAQLSKSGHPLLFRWIESAAAIGNGHAFAGPPPSFGATLPGAHAPGGALAGQQNPLLGSYLGFLATVEQFRRALFHSRQVTSTRELDKVAELEGDLAIEVGKVTNQIALKFQQLAAREGELQAYLEAFQGADLPIAGARFSMAGWIYLLEHLQFAKNWARRSGKSALVRDLNVLIKDGIFGLSEVILEHCNSLDTLITEAFSHYGIAYEIYGELSPFAGFTGPAPGASEREPAFAGAYS